MPGLDPLSVDLSTVTAVADLYTADLQDNGTGDVQSLSSQIGRLVARIQALRGVAPVVVAHSTAGIAARLYVAANASQIQGLITLGTPHTGSPLTPLTDPPTAEALRWITHMFPGEVAAGPLRDALLQTLQRRTRTTSGDDLWCFVDQAQVLGLSPDDLSGPPVRHSG